MYRLSPTGVIVLGEGQGSFLPVCIAKKDCEHWGRPKATASRGAEEEADEAEARKQQEEA